MASLNLNIHGSVSSDDTGRTSPDSPVTQMSEGEKRLAECIHQLLFVKQPENAPITHQPENAPITHQPENEPGLVFKLFSRILTPKPPQQYLELDALILSRQIKNKLCKQLHTLPEAADRFVQTDRAYTTQLEAFVGGLLTNTPHALASYNTQELTAFLQPAITHVLDQEGITRSSDDYRQFNAMYRHFLTRVSTQVARLAGEKQTKAEARA